MKINDNFVSRVQHTFRFFDTKHNIAKLYIEYMRLTIQSVIHVTTHIRELRILAIHY